MEGLQKHLCVTCLLLTVIIIFYIGCNYEKLTENFSSQPLDIKIGYDSENLVDNSNIKPVILSQEQMNQVGGIEEINKKKLDKNDIVAAKNNLVPKGNVDYNDYDLNFTTNNVFRDKESNIDKSPIKNLAKNLAKNKVKTVLKHEKEVYGNDACDKVDDKRSCETSSHPDPNIKAPSGYMHYSLVNYGTIESDEIESETESHSEHNEDVHHKEHHNLPHKEHDNNHIKSKKKINKVKNNKKLDVVKHDEDKNYDDEKCEVFREGVDRLNDSGFLHNKQYSWNNTFKEDCGDF